MGYRGGDLVTKQLRQAVATPTHALVSNGTSADSSLGYATLAQLKTALGLPANLAITTTNPVNGSIAVWQSGQLTITDQNTTETLTDGGNF
jgi:hypothetical protein